MKIEELSIGDWVFHLAEMQAGRISHIHRIGGIYSIGLDCADCVVVCGINDIAPIPLTPEILEKNGETSKDHPAWLIAGRAVVEKEPTGEYSVHIYDAAIDKILVTARAQHVHQLQHALRLAGIEKEIEV